MMICMNDEECTRKCIIDELMGFLPGMAEFSESANVTQYKEPSAVVVFLDLTLKLTSLLKSEGKLSDLLSVACWNESARQ